MELWHRNDEFVLVNYLNSHYGHTLTLRYFLIITIPTTSSVLLL